MSRRTSKYPAWLPFTSIKLRAYEVHSSKPWIRRVLGGRGAAPGKLIATYLWNKKTYASLSVEGKRVVVEVKQAQIWARQKYRGTHPEKFTDEPAAVPVAKLEWASMDRPLHDFQIRYLDGIEEKFTAGKDLKAEIEHALWAGITMPKDRVIKELKTRSVIPHDILDNLYPAETRMNTDDSCEVHTS